MLKLVIWRAWCLHIRAKHRNVHIEVQPGILWFFERFKVSLLRAVWVGTGKLSFLSCLFPSVFLLVILGLNPDVWDWKTRHLAKEVLQKIVSAEFGSVKIPRSPCYDSG